VLSDGFERVVWLERDDCNLVIFHGSATTVPTELKFCHRSAIVNYEEISF
jgi:DNA-binding LytR/AlgR family response regulator